MKVATIEMAPDDRLLTAEQVRSILNWVSNTWRDNAIKTHLDTMTIYKVVPK